jgi:hypothetical protein
MGNIPVSARPNGMFDLAERVVEEAAGTIAYDDELRTGDEFNFEPVTEEIAFRCHVGPERSWQVLGEFLVGTDSVLVSSIYEFHATISPTQLSASWSE